MAGRLLIDNGVIVTLGARNRVLHGYALLCDDGRIAAIAPRREISGPFDRVIDASGKIVLPGFINAHMHFYSTLVRGLGKAEPSKDFVEVLEHLWWRLDKQLSLDECYASALVACIDAIRHGTTTLIDHHASPGACRGSLAAVAGAVRHTGLRASLCYEVSDRDGEGIATEGLNENIEFISRCLAERNQHIKALFGLHAAFTLSDATLDRAAEAGQRLGVGFHIHVAEAESDQEHSVKNFGIRVVERLARHGILGPNSIAAHAVHIDEGEMDLLAKTGTAVVHNPQSNMNNAVGTADVPRMLAQRVIVGLGTDAMTTNMLEELRAALWIRHHATANPSAGFLETTSLLLGGNPTIANRYWDGMLGELTAGKAADIVLIDYHPPTPFDESTFLGHLVFGLSQSTVDTTIVDGRVLMTNKRLELDLDEAEVAAQARVRAKALWERF